MSDLIRKDSIEELAGHRDRALELARQALELLVQAELAAKRAGPSLEYHGGFLSSLDRGDMYALGGDDKDNVDKVMDGIRRRVDGYAWKSLQKVSGLRNLMDATAHEQFSKKLDEEPPAFTVDNAVATFASLAAQAPEIFERSLVAVFERLNTRDYKTNSAFRIGPRIILTYCFHSYGWSHWGSKRELMADLDRIMHVLDGKKPPEAGNAADYISAQYNAKETTAVTEYFEARMFRGNGNLHLKFRRPDLLEKANRIIAKHYGTAIPDDRKGRAA